MNARSPRPSATIRPRLRGLPAAGSRRTAIAAALALLCASPAFPIAAVNPVLGYSVDLPVGWREAANDDPYHIGFFSPNGEAMLQVIALDPATAADGVGIVRHVLGQVSGRGEPAAFVYEGRPAALGPIEFTTSGMQVRGYILAIDTPDADYALLAFAVRDAYETAHPHLVSALDSFALDGETRAVPGPISAFLHPADPARPRATGVPFGDRVLSLAYDPGEVEATTALIEREALILGPYGALGADAFAGAWRRFFRMIYRDNSARLGDLAAQVWAALRADGHPRVDYPAVLLSWLQGFTFERTGGLADFMSPLQSIVTASGDCDSLAMVYVILLHHLGFDAIIMASDRYAHALAAVDVAGPGARFPFEGREWLVAELTAEVPLGRIAANMADPAGWIGVRLRLEAGR